MSPVKDHFETVDDYDTVADNVVYKNDELHRYLISALRFWTSKKKYFLDLGCGTGHGMELILKKYPYSHVVGIDFSDRMIDKAKERFEKNNLSDRVTLLERDFTSEEAFLDLDGNPANYKGIISAVAIHNIPYVHRDDEKKKLFARIFNHLTPGGIFVNGDFIKGETLSEDTKLRTDYERFLKSNLSDGELDAWLKHAFGEDSPMKLSAQKKMLRSLGFVDIQERWRHKNEAVYSARKPYH